MSIRRVVRQASALLRELLAARAAHGPYRFLVKSWVGTADSRLAARMVQAECFKRELEPLPLPVTGLKSILVLAPHQDDESVGAGGTLVTASQAGVRIDVLYLTDGAQRNKWCAPEEMVELRRSEARAACSRLNAGYHELGLSNLEPRPTFEAVDTLAQLILKLRPQVILAPWVLDSPPKHRLVTHLLWFAAKRHRLPEMEVWGYQVHNTLIPNGYVDITPVASEKLALLECFETQNRHRHYDHLAMGMAAWNSRLVRVDSDEKRYLEVFFTLPFPELLKLVEQFYVRDLEAVYLDEIDLLSAMRELQRKQLRQRAPFRSPRSSIEPQTIAVGDTE